MRSLSGVESEIFTSGEFALDSGVRLPRLELAYETYGALAPHRDNVILLVHGYTSSHHAAGTYAPGKNARGVGAGAVGWYDALIGPGKAVDTDRYFVVSVNALGSAHGSSGPNAIDPRTGRAYGPTFPEITMRDIVAAERVLVDSLGIERLVAVIGPSMGGFQSFQWAASYPGFVGGIAAAVTAPRSPSGLAQVAPLQRRLAADANWNDGWYYENGGIAGTLRELRFETLMSYGMNEILAREIPDQARRTAAIRAAADEWAQTYDGHSLVTLRKAIGTFDITDRYEALRATKVLNVQSTTDSIFDIADGPRHAMDMRRAGVDVTYVELPTDQGHMASHADAALWAPILGAFLGLLG